MAGGYDAGYRACPCFWGKDPGRLVRLLLARVATVDGWSVLDAGCGEGKNAAFLASLGANVRAVDISQFAIANAKTNWGTPQRVRWEVADVRSLQHEAAEFDLIIGYGLLHCFQSAAQVVNVIAQFQRATRPGGYNILCSYNDRRPLDRLAHDDFEPCLFSHRLIEQAYDRWRLHHISDEDLTERHPNNDIPHTHAMTRLLGEKV